jgi:hypothetical protein
VRNRWKARFDADSPSNLSSFNVDNAPSAIEDSSAV